MALKIATEPATEPVTLAEAKAHLRVDVDDDDTLIDGLIMAARQIVEEVAGRALITQTWDLVRDTWPGGDALKLPRPPLQSVTSIKYLDEDGNESTYSAGNYIVDTYSEPGRIGLAANASWPSTTLYPIAGVRVRFVAGYGDQAADVPQKYKQAILLLAGHFYEHREEISAERNLQRLPLGVDALLWLDRVKGF